MPRPITSTSLLQIGIAILFALAIGGYAYTATADFIRGPVVSIETPHDGATLSHALVSIDGVAENAAHITLNGRKIFTNEAGQFSEQLLLSYGYNIMTITAADRFGRETTKRLDLVYK